MSEDVNKVQERSYIMDLREKLIRMQYEQDPKQFDALILDLMMLLRALSASLGETAPEFEYPGILQDVADGIDNLRGRLWHCRYLGEMITGMKSANEELRAAAKDRNAEIASHEQTIAILNKRLEEAENRIAAPVIPPKKDAMKITIELNSLDDIQQLRQYLDTAEQAVKKHAVTLDDLDLTTRTRNCLKSAQIETVEQILAMTPNQIFKIPEMGRKSLRDLRDNLSAHGIKWGN